MHSSWGGGGGGGEQISGAFPESRVAADGKNSDMHTFDVAPPLVENISLGNN